jgi:hypothetical protein
MGLEGDGWDWEGWVRLKRMSEVEWSWGEFRGNSGEAEEDRVQDGGLVEAGVSGLEVVVLGGVGRLLVWAFLMCWENSVVESGICIL